jgi:hypothetical protein
MGEVGEYYKHHFGETKFQNPIVPTNYFLDDIDTKKII